MSKGSFRRGGHHDEGSRPAGAGDVYVNPAFERKRLYALIKARATGDKDAIGENRKLRAG